MNLALPQFVFSEPAPPKRITTSLDYKLALQQGPVKSVPNNFTKWDMHVLSAPITVRQIIDWFKTTYSLDVDTVMMGKVIWVQYVAM